ncbi:hypothetical protein CDO73_10295 [Saccharibacillus sp. O23]|uniref:RNA 2'-phosphotransferase n=1 Tax=Saccharibacillus sp. O23 TaxID=2009338 RepID=UPI000B4E09B0|nr:RNA 2'-phosphotransferase [Saccharibacillus sp. O23]OWR30963.1 hypothetical protein CDO73_10295 [Saccharibacillus sp. O23]
MGKSKKNSNSESKKTSAGSGNPYRGQGQQPKLSTAERDKKISKLMSMMLRHSPEEFGLKLDPEDGSCGLDELLEAMRRRTGYEQTTEEEIRGVVRRSDKQRFEIIESGASASESGPAAENAGGEAVSERSDGASSVGGTRETKVKPETTGVKSEISDPQEAAGKPITSGNDTEEAASKAGSRAAEAVHSGGSSVSNEGSAAPRIRARYGHSFGRVTYPEGTPPSVLYHGTSRHAMPSIEEHGLLPMGREYVHLSAETQFAALAGRRKGKLVMLRLDTAAAAEAGVVFYDAGSGVWLAERIPSDLMAEDETYEDKPGR